MFPLMRVLLCAITTVCNRVTKENIVNKVIYMSFLLVAATPYLLAFVAWSKLTGSGEDGSWFVVGAFFLLGYWTWVVCQILVTLRRGCVGTVSS